MMYMIDHEAIFDMFLPAPGEFILDIGKNTITFFKPIH